MPRILIYLIVLISISSCKPATKLHIDSQSVIFYPDNSMFDSVKSFNQDLAYFDLKTLELSKIELLKGKPVEIQISNPTFFIDYYPFLVYPGDLIHVSLNADSFIDFSIDNNLQRLTEFRFIKKFKDSWVRRESGLGKQFGNAVVTQPASLDSLVFQTGYIYELKMKFLDSLLSLENRGEEAFANNFKMFCEPDSVNGLIALYELNRNLLRKENLYINKYRDLIPVINRSKTEEQVQYGYWYSIEKVADVILPYKIHLINKVSEFESCFDSTIFYFKGVAREYVLTKLMERAHRKKIELTGIYKKRYFTECTSSTYTAIVDDWLKSQRDISITMKRYGSDAISSYNGQNVTTLNTLFHNNSGKLIVLDFWASWCVPCLTEIPYEKQLEKFFAADQVVFIKISVDTEIRKWQNSIQANGINSENSYIFVNSGEADFIKKYGLELIPRYMILGKDGTLLNENAPVPSNPELTTLIQTYFSQH